MGLNKCIMSEMADMYREFDARQKEKRQKNLKWNTDVVLGLCEEYGVEVKINSEYHFSLFHPKLGRMDYWPSTSRIGWFHGKKQYGKTAFVKDIEAYLMTHFNPQDK